MSNIIRIKNDYGPEIADLHRYLKTGIIDFGILAYKFPSGMPDIIAISNGTDITDIEVIDLLESLIATIKDQSQIEDGF